MALPNTTHFRMESKYLPPISANLLKEKQSESHQAVYDLLVTPLHEELYRRQTFEFLDDLSNGQQLMLSYDYVREQVAQGGFIQLLQNGYVGLLPDMPAWLYAVNDPEMAQIIDDVLKVFVLNNEVLNRQTTIEEFAKLYEEFKEFEVIEERFRQWDEKTIVIIADYALAHLNEFATVED